MDKSLKKKELALHSSAAEYLTFVTSIGDSDESFEMRKEHLKKGHMFTDEYFEHQLQHIREIRLSEQKFY